jgi:hypothetical protein
MMAGISVHDQSERAFMIGRNRRSRWAGTRNQRLAYVAVSRGRYDAQIYTNDKAQLGEALSRDVSHRSAIETGRAPELSAPKLEQSVLRRKEAELTIAR